MSALPEDFSALVTDDALAADRLADLQTRIADVRHRPSTVVLETLQRPTTFTRIPKLGLAVCAAGGRPALDETDAVTHWDDVVFVQPEMIVLALPGRSLDEAIAEFVSIADFPMWRDLPATYLNQIYVADLGPATIDAVELLAGLLHPNLCTPPAAERARRVSPLLRVELRQ